jgi:hypothetical protein
MTVCAGRPLIEVTITVVKSVSDGLRDLRLN